MNSTFHRIVLAAVTSGMLSAIAMPAMADSTEDIVNALVAKGVLTEEEGALLMKGRAGEKEAAAKMAKKQAVVEMGKSGLRVKSGDGDFSMQLGGRVQADWSDHSGDDHLAGGKEGVDGTEIRRARINVKGTAFKDFYYQIETDFAKNAVGMKDVVVAYTGFEPFELTFGQQKPNMSMEIEESSNDIMFIERSLVSPLAFYGFDRAIGTNLKASGHDWSAMAGIWGDAISPGNANLDEGRMWSARATWAPINEADRLIHLGFGYGDRHSAENNSSINSHNSTISLNTTNMSQLALTSLTNGTGANTFNGNIEGFAMADLEFSAMYGPLSFQSEFTRATVDRSAGSNINLDAYYMQVGWTLTGESRTYVGSDGEFKRLKPKSNFDLKNGTWGAWELAARYDMLDMIDKDVDGGKQKRWTLGVNWYLNDSIRLMADWSRAFSLSGNALKHTNGSYADDIDVFAMRAQWAF